MNSKERLDQMIRSEKIPHALLFIGRREAEEEAYRFASNVIALSGEHHRKKLLSKNHPDLYRYFPEGKTAMHPLKTLRELSQETALVPLESKWKVFLIHDADRMQIASAHALLKTLEEPPSFTLIILISQYPEKILSTIRSRCQRVEFLTTTYRAVEVLEVLGGNLAKEEFIEKVQDKITSDPAFVQYFFETIMLWFRDRQLLEMGEEASRYLSFPEKIDSIQRTPYQPLDKVEKIVKLIKLGLERSIKFSTCIDLLFLNLNLS